MAFLSRGTLEGLAARHDFYRDAQLNLQVDQQNRQAQIDAENKAALLGDMFRFGKANNPYDQSKLKQYSENTIKEIGNMTRNNPNWMQDPDTYIQVKQKADSLLNNEWVTRSTRHDAEIKRMQDAAAKDPTVIKRKSYQQQLEAAKNYQTTGSIDGIEGNNQEFAYIPVDPYVNLWERVAKNSANYHDFVRIPDTSPFAGDGAYDEMPNPQSFEAFAHSTYEENKEQIDDEYSKAGYSTPWEYTVALVRAGLKGKHEPGNYASKVKRMDLEAKMKGGQYGGTGIWDRDVAAMPMGYLDAGGLKLFGPNGTEVRVIGETGSSSNPHIDFGYRKVDWGTHFRTMKWRDPLNGKDQQTKVMEAVTTLQPQEAKQLGITDPNWFEGDLEQNDLSSNWINNAWIQKDTKGKDVVKVKVWYPFDDGSVSGNRSLATTYESLQGVPAEQKTLGYKAPATDRYELNGREIIINDAGNGWVYKDDGTEAK